MVLTDGVHGPALAPTEMLVLNAVLVSVCFVLLCKPSSNNKANILLLSCLTLAAAASRVLLEPLPNIQPLTVMCLLMGASLVARRGMAFAVMATLLSNMVLSHGLWTLYQASGWAFIAFIGSKIKIVEGQKLVMKNLVAVSILTSILFDWWVSVSVYRYGMSLNEFALYILNGIPFDLMHALGSIVTAVCIAPYLLNLLNAYPSTDNKELPVGEVNVIIS